MSGSGDSRSGTPGSGGETRVWDDMVLVGRIARPHGIRGHVVINPETDFVDERFAPGARLWVRSDRGC